MYCRFCGTRIESDSKFCQECGKSITEHNNPQTTKMTPGRLDLIKKHSKDVIYLLWWTLFILILGIFAYYDCRDFEDVIILLPLYFGVILFVYTRRFYKNRKDLGEEVAEYSLQDFANIYGNMQICRYIDQYGVARSKCVFTRSIDVGFSREVGELNTKEVAANKKNLLVKKLPHGDGYLLIAKEGATIVKYPSTSTPPPLDKVSNKI